MTPTEFDFTIKMPGDSRLVSAIRQLTAHAAGYARLAPEAGDAFAAHVERATEQAITASKAQTALIEYRFTADADAIVVVFSCDVGPTSHPPSSSAGAVSVEWATEGMRHVCRIRREL
jgi:hypothetical protein